MAQQLKVTRVFEERYPEIDLEHHVGQTSTDWTSAKRLRDFGSCRGHGAQHYNGGWGDTVTPFDVDLGSLNSGGTISPELPRESPSIGRNACLIAEVGALLGHEREAQTAILTDFHECCKTLLEKVGANWRVAARAFELVAGAGYSRVICLAVQQVLVVERMLNDEYYSENSYFPRYHEVLCI